MKYQLRRMPWKKGMMMNLDVRTPTAEIVEKLNRFSPVMLGGYPSGLELLADEQAAGRLHISPAIVMTGGELLRDEVREKLADAFGGYVQTNYSCTEGGTMCHECVNRHLHINDEWIGKVNELKTRLQRGKEIAEQINILGDDGVPVEYHVIFWKSELIDFVILQQDAFDEVDSVTPMERQEAILNMIIDICHTEFEFDNFNEVMDYFKRMINVCKQMNYSKFKSEQYEGFQQQLKELIAERSVK